MVGQGCIMSIFLMAEVGLVTIKSFFEFISSNSRVRFHVSICCFSDCGSVNYGLRLTPALHWACVRASPAVTARLLDNDLGVLSQDLNIVLGNSLGHARHALVAHFYCFSIEQLM